MRNLSRAGGLLVTLAGVFVLVGWLTGMTLLTVVHRGYVSMKPTAALAFVILGLAVLALGRKRLAIPLGAAAVFLGTATLLEYLLGQSLLVDELVPGIDSHGDSLRMAPATALLLLLLGVAVMAGSSGRGTAMRGIALCCFGMSQVTLLGYLYGDPAFYTVGSATAMAPATAVCSAVLSLILLAHRPSAGFVGLLRDDGSAGRMLRPLVPFLLVGPLLLGRLSLFAHERGWIGTRSEVVWLVISMTVVGAGVSWRAALRLRELDRQRNTALAGLAETNRSLDATVQERTRELATSLVDVHVEKGRVEAANAGLEEANQAIRGFTAVAAHDLRSPITSIAGFSELLTQNWETLSEERRRKFVETIGRQSRKLSMLVDDILAVSSIEDGVLRTSPELIVLRQAMDRCLGLVNEDTARVSVSCPPDLVVWVDPLHLGRILDNYVQNAFKYGEPPIRMEASRINAAGPLAEPVEMIEVRVLDSGPGVPAEFTSRLFGKFTRADTSATRAQEGTGLGLSIVRGLAEVNGGQARYEPRVPNGSCFAVALPAPSVPGHDGVGGQR